MGGVGNGSAARCRNVPVPLARRTRPYSKGHPVIFRSGDRDSSVCLCIRMAMNACLPVTDHKRCSRRSELRLRGLRRFLVVALTLGGLCMAPAVAGAAGPVVELSI